MFVYVHVHVYGCVCVSVDVGVAALAAVTKCQPCHIVPWHRPRVVVILIGESLETPVSSVFQMGGGGGGASERPARGPRGVEDTSLTTAVPTGTWSWPVGVC